LEFNFSLGRFFGTYDIATKEVTKTQYEADGPFFEFVKSPEEILGEERYAILTEMLDRKYAESKITYNGLIWNLDNWRGKVSVTLAHTGAQLSLGSEEAIDMFDVQFTPQKIFLGHDGYLYCGGYIEDGHIFVRISAQNMDQILDQRLIQGGIFNRKTGEVTFDPSIPKSKNNTLYIRRDNGKPIRGEWKPERKPGVDPYDPWGNLRWVGPEHYIIDKNRRMKITIPLKKTPDTVKPQAAIITERILADNGIASYTSADSSVKASSGIATKIAIPIMAGLMGLAAPVFGQEQTFQKNLIASQLGVDTISVNDTLSVLMGGEEECEALMQRLETDQDAAAEILKDPSSLDVFSVEQKDELLYRAAHTNMSAAIINYKTIYQYDWAKYEFLKNAMQADKTTKKLFLEIPYKLYMDLAAEEKYDLSYIARFQNQSDVYDDLEACDWQDYTFADTAVRSDQGAALYFLENLEDFKHFSEEQKDSLVYSAAHTNMFGAIYFYPKIRAYPWAQYDFVKRAIETTRNVLNVLFYLPDNFSYFAFEERSALYHLAAKKTSYALECFDIIAHYPWAYQFADSLLGVSNSFASYSILRNIAKFKAPLGSHKEKEESDLLHKVVMYDDMATIESFPELSRYEWAGATFVIALLKKKLHRNQVTYSYFEGLKAGAFDAYTEDDKRRFAYTAIKATPYVAVEYYDMLKGYPESYDLIKRKIEADEIVARCFLEAKNMYQYYTPIELETLKQAAVTKHKHLAIIFYEDIADYAWCDYLLIKESVGRDIKAAAFFLKGPHRFFRSAPQGLFLTDLKKCHQYYSEEQIETLAHVAAKTNSTAALESYKNIARFVWTYDILVEAIKANPKETSVFMLQSPDILNSYTEDEKDGFLYQATELNPLAFIQYFPFVAQYNWAPYRARDIIKKNDVALYYALEDPARFNGLETEERNKILMQAAERVPECACFFRDQLLQLENSPFDEAYFDLAIEENLDSFLSVGLSEFSGNVRHAIDVEPIFDIALEDTELYETIKAKTTDLDLSDGQKTSIAVASIRLCKALGIPYTNPDYFERSVDVILYFLNQELSDIIFGEKDRQGREIQVIILLDEVETYGGTEDAFSRAEQEAFVRSTGVLEKNMQSFKYGEDGRMNAIRAIEESVGPLRILYKGHANDLEYGAWNLNYRLLAETLMKRENIEDVYIISDGCLTTNFHENLGEYLGERGHLSPKFRIAPSNDGDLGFVGIFDFLTHIQEQREKNNRMNKPVTLWDMFMGETETVFAVQDPSCILAMTPEKFKKVIKEQFKDVLSKEKLKEIFAEIKEMPDVSVELFDMFGGLTQGKKERELLAFFFLLGLIPGISRMRPDEKRDDEMQLKSLEWKAIADNPENHHSERTYANMKYKLAVASMGNPNAQKIIDKATRLLDDQSGSQREPVRLRSASEGIIKMVLSNNGVASHVSADAFVAVSSSIAKKIAVPVMAGLMAFAAPAIAQGQGQTQNQANPSTTQTTIDPTKTAVVDTIKINDTLSYKRTFNIISRGTGTDPGEFNNPQFITTDSKGMVYVADGTNNNVQTITIDEIITEPTATVQTPVTKQKVVKKKLNPPSKQKLVFPNIATSFLKVEKLKGNKIEDWHFNRITGEYTFPNQVGKGNTLYIDYTYTNGIMVPSATWDTEDAKKRDTYDESNRLRKATKKDYTLDEQGHLTLRLPLIKGQDVKDQLKEDFKEIKIIYNQVFNSNKGNNYKQSLENLLKARTKVELNIKDLQSTWTRAREGIGDKEADRIINDLEVIKEQLDSLIKGFNKAINPTLDKAMVTKDVLNKNDVGGIDLNAQYLDLKTEGIDMDFELPLQWQGVDLNNVPGLVPVFINIIPVMNFPAFVAGEENIDEELINVAKL